MRALTESELQTLNGIQSAYGAEAAKAYMNRLSRQCCGSCSHYCPTAPPGVGECGYLQTTIWSFEEGCSSWSPK
jgi:hypothetical protein